MNDHFDAARSLHDALPFIRRSHGHTAVIKYGGSAMEGNELPERITADIALLKYVGLKPVVVHGGGPEITAMLKRVGHESSFQRGLRVTDPETMEITEMVLSGKVNKDLVQRLCRHEAPAVGVSGKDGRLFTAEKRLHAGTDLGRVGRITEVRIELIRSLADAGYIPVIAPVSAGAEGTTYNINADEAAVEIAAALGAEKLIFLTDVAGILKDPSDAESLIAEMDMQRVRTALEDGTISGGMIPKTEAALSALERGAGTVHIIDGTIHHALLLEIFTEKGIGTLITKELRQ